MHRPRTLSRYAPACLLILALLARALVPAGFMPGGTKDGYVSIEICTSGGLASVLVPKDEAPAPKEGHGNSDPCPFTPSFSKTLGIVPVMAVAAVLRAIPPLFPHMASSGFVRTFTAYDPHAPPVPPQGNLTLIPTFLR